MGNVCGHCKERSAVAPATATDNGRVLTIPRRISRWSLRRRSSVVSPAPAMPIKRASLSSCIVEVDESLSNSRGSLRMLGSFRSGRSVRLVMKHSESVCSERSLKSVLTKTTTRVKLDTQIAASYNPLHIIGRGSFSTVLSIEDKASGVKYALKIIKKKKLTSSAHYTELDILRKLRHPHIVRLHEAYTTRNKIYLILELANGGDLCRRLTTVGRYTEAGGSAIIGMLLQALGYLHDIGITHRDVKMENCLFKTPDEYSIILLSDFGLAHPNSNAMQTTCGTVPYICPEMILGEVYTHLIDMWSLGVITYTILCGVVPFSGHNLTTTYNKIISASYNTEGEIWQELSSAAKEFISGLLTVDASDRWSAKIALQSSWTNNTD